jgi:hypothetical protein
MMPSIVVHIGPPKTATTSLQLALQQVEHPKFYYGGTFQPRERNTDSLCQKIYRTCSNQLETRPDIKNLRNELGGLLEAGKTVFLSEEMLLLEQDTASIKTKLNILKKILQDFEYQILISARPGRDALPSFYQEVFNSLPVRLQLDFAAFCRDKRSLCYDYSAVCKLLTEVGLENITIFEFNRLSTDGIDLSAFTRLQILETKILTLKKANTGQTGKSTSTRMLPSVSLKNIGRLAPVKYLVNRLKIREIPGYKYIILLLDRVKFRAHGERNLVVPDDVADRLDNSYLDAVNRYGMQRQNKRADLT